MSTFVPDHRLSRRALLGAGAAIGAAALSGAGPMAFAQTGGSPSGPRIAALGWACAQTILALGVVPLVIPEIERYGRLVVEPAIPPGVQEIGLRSEPNLELLQSFEVCSLLSSEMVVAHADLQLHDPIRNIRFVSKGFGSSTI